MDVGCRSDLARGQKRRSWFLARGHSALPPRLYFLCLAQVDGAGQDSRARERFPLCFFGFRRSAGSVRLREAQLRADFAVPARGQQSPYLISHLYFRRDKALFSCPANHATQCGIKAMSSGECKRMRKETPVVAPCIGCKPRKETVELCMFSPMHWMRKRP